MKKLSFKELGGACKEEIAGATFADIGSKCREHVISITKAGDAAQRVAADKMSNATPAQEQKMMAEFEKRFNSRPKA